MMFTIHFKLIVLLISFNIYRINAESTTTVQGKEINVEQHVHDKQDQMGKVHHPDHRNSVQVNEQPDNDLIHVDDEIKHETFHLWLYASGAVLFISLAGLLSILVIPLIKKHHQGDILQLLVGLGIGTLVSDALLHLLPHVSVAIMIM